MIRVPVDLDTALLCPTSRAHVDAAIKDDGGEPTLAGGYLYAVRKLPRLGQPLILRCSVGAS